MKHAADIPTIVGAGPTGLLLGCLLLQRGLACQLIERRDAPSSLSRALMIHSASLDILDTVGLAEPVIAAGLRQRYIRFLCHNGPTHTLDFNELGPTAYPFFVNLRQPVLEQLLRHRFLALGGALHQGVEAVALANDADAVRLTVRTASGRQRIEAPWIVGCDGARSFVRVAAGIGFPGERYPFSYVLAEGRCATRWPRDASAMVLGPESTFSVLPMETGEVRIAGPGLQQDLDGLRMSPARFAAMLRHAGFPESLRLTSYSALRQYRVQERLADTFARGRVFLCGDAAHLHSPAGGQAMNTGFGDAFALAWRLARSEELAAAVRRYDAERRPLARAVIDRTRILPVLAAMRRGDISALQLRHMTRCFSQLFHRVGRRTTLDATKLATGGRLPNLRLSGGHTVWRDLRSDTVDIGPSQGELGRALADYFGIQADRRIRVRPDYVIGAIDTDHQETNT